MFNFLKRLKSEMVLLLGIAATVTSGISWSSMTDFKNLINANSVVVTIYYVFLGYLVFKLGFFLLVLFSYKKFYIIIASAILVIDMLAGGLLLFMSAFAQSEEGIGAGLLLMLAGVLSVVGAGISAPKDTEAI